MSEKCPVCVSIGKMCDEVGASKFCSELMARLERKEIDTQQFVDELLKNPEVAKKLSVKD